MATPRLGSGTACERQHVIAAVQTAPNAGWHGGGGPERRSRETAPLEGRPRTSTIHEAVCGCLSSCRTERLAQRRIFTGRAAPWPGCRRPVAAPRAGCLQGSDSHPLLGTAGVDHGGYLRRRISHPRAAVPRPGRHQRAKVPRPAPPLQTLIAPPAFLPLPPLQSLQRHDPPSPADLTRIRLSPASVFSC